MNLASKDVTVQVAQLKPPMTPDSSDAVAHSLVNLRDFDGITRAQEAARICGEVIDYALQGQLNVVSQK